MTTPRSLAALALLLGSSSVALAGVSPELYSDTLEPGESVDISKIVDVPEDTPKLDFVLLVDLSGSYYNDLPNIRATAPSLFDSIAADVPDSRFALATFRDFPIAPWGASSDYAYRLDQDFTTDKTTWTTAVDAMSASGGYDFPESQYEGLYQLVTGAGRDLPTADGDYTDLGEIAPGQNVVFRADATKVVAITTDASFHEGGETGSGPYPYPGATQAETIAALVGQGVKVIAIKAPGSGTEMDTLASSTGGSVVSTSSTSAEIATAVLDGLDALTYEISASPDAECVLDLSYAPASFSGVSGGETVTFTETIAVPLDITSADLDADGYATCEVEFLADDTVIGVQTVDIEVPLNSPPVAVCQDLVLSADSTCSAAGDVDDGSYDPDGDALVYSYSDEGPYPVGTTTVTLTVTDPSGESDSCTATVEVNDTTPPSVSVGGGDELWPPNHKYEDLYLSDCDVVITDSCSGTLDVDSVATIVGISSDEPENANGNGDGNTVADMVINDASSFSLRAERAGSLNGRVYSVEFDVEDGAGNTTTATCDFSVPKSNNGTPAVDDGASWSVYY